MDTGRFSCTLLSICSTGLIKEVITRASGSMSGTNVWLTQLSDSSKFTCNSADGTCMSTLRPQCIKDYKPGDDLVIFIKRTIGLFQLLPTNLFLKLKGSVTCRG